MIWGLITALLADGLILADEKAKTNKASTKIVQMNREMVQQTNDSYNRLIKKEIDKLLQDEEIYGDAMHSYSSRAAIGIIERYITTAQESAKRHNGTFELQPDLLKTYQRLKHEHEEFERKLILKHQEEERKRLEEKKRKEEEQQRVQMAQMALLQERERLKAQCGQILSEANYEEVQIDLEEGSSRSAANGYRKGSIKAKKNNESYAASFGSIMLEGLPFAGGHTLILMLANVLANVDLADVEHRDANIKEQIESEQVCVHNIAKKHQWSDNYLKVLIQYNGEPISLELYSSLVIQSEQVRKQEEEKKKIREEYAAKQIQEEKMQQLKKKVTEQCIGILTAANYNDVQVHIQRDFSGWLTNGEIKTQKNGALYHVAFMNRDKVLSYEEGCALTLALAKILGKVDISDVESRDDNLKAEFEAVKIPALQIWSRPIDKDNYRYVTIQCNGKPLAIRFYSSIVINVPVHRLPEETVHSSVVQGSMSAPYSANYDAMEGHQFERFCAELLRRNGFQKVSVTQGSGDQGIDIIAVKDGIKYGIQCKCYTADIGNKAVQEVFAGKTFYHCHVGIVLTNRYFTKSAIDLAQANGIVLWNRDRLKELIANAK